MTFTLLLCSYNITIILKLRKIKFYFKALSYSPVTVSWAVERLLPATKTMGPDIELSVEVRQRLWRFPSLLMFTAAQGSSTSPFRLHRGGLPDFRLVSTWNSAGSGSITTTELIPRTILIACSACTATIHINEYWTQLLTRNRTEKHYGLHSWHMRNTCA